MLNAESKYVKRVSNWVKTTSWGWKIELFLMSEVPS